jgi:excisionase family DNA binding protein
MERLAVTTHEAARLLSTSRSNLYTMINAGKLRKIKMGGKALIAVDDLKAFIESLKSAA